MRRPRLLLPALALAAALGLTACGGDGSSTGAASGHAGHGGSSSKTAVGSAADVAFLQGMRPHHEQAVEMSDLVLAADPPAGVAALATRVKQAQSPEIAQMDALLADLGAQEGHDGDHAAHGGMMSAADLQALGDATGVEAARLYLQAMIAHHEGAVEASEAEVAEGEHEPVVALARSIAADQTAEIAEMQALLAGL